MHSKEEDWEHLFSLSTIRRPKGQPLKFRKRRLKNNLKTMFCGILFHSNYNEASVGGGGYQTKHKQLKHCTKQKR